MRATIVSEEAETRNVSLFSGSTLFSILSWKILSATLLASLSMALSQFIDSDPDSVVRPRMESLSKDFFWNTGQKVFLKLILLTAPSVVDLDSSSSSSSCLSFSEGLSIMALVFVLSLTRYVFVTGLLLYGTGLMTAPSLSRINQ